ncbi:hypothetical protein DPMN_019658 [Dreissena polymorpha]|uniref:Uncharacterized protein n=1 Tax=Dreissena polymorpha TaxID=45954 RepID=A0A9D4NIW6_DREPO|nr:hypothetical protein DPMN_019552 [Dreissena polymorpha]KAH3895493.1 hypothetical protein DPMN_019658 [Dreissena polymorpha]
MGKKQSSLVGEDADIQHLLYKPTRNKHNPRLRHGQKLSMRRPCQVFTRRIAEALGIDLGNNAKSDLTSRTCAE